MSASRPVSAATIVEKPRRTSFFSRMKADSLQDPEKEEEIETDVPPPEPASAPASFLSLFRFVTLKFHALPICNFYTVLQPDLSCL